MKSPLSALSLTLALALPTLALPSLAPPAAAAEGPKAPDPHHASDAPTPDAAEPDMMQPALLAARRGDTAQAAALFLPLARKGDPRAQFNLALLFFAGRGLPQNHAEALYWAWRARLGGIAQAATLIARLSDAATPEARQAVADRIIADLSPLAETGDGGAMLRLSMVFLEVQPQPDPATAYLWQALSAALETPNAARARDATLAMIPVEDRALAQQAAMDKLKSLCAAGLTDPICAALF